MQYDGVVIFSLESRAFSRQDILKAIIASSGGYVVGLAVVWETWELWKLIEIIETTAELQDAQRIASE